MSSYFNIFRSIFQTAVEVWPERRITSSFLWDFLTDLREYGRVSFQDIVSLTCIAFLLTLLRSTLTALFFTPFAVSMKFTPKNIKKFPESLWKFLYYLMMFIYTYSLLIGDNYPYFKEPKTCWTEWSVGMQVPTDVYYLYAIQASFYIHSIYATLYMDPWRRDSTAMIIHHVLTIFLICFSYAIRYYKAGVVVLLLHDNCDVVLEFTKLCICWKTRDKKHYYIFEILTNIGFLLFAFSWFYCRLYLYPYKVLYPAGYYAIRLIPHAPFYYFFNGLLLFLFAMDVWWFHFIVLLIWRVATGEMREVEDTRDVGIKEENETNSSPDTDKIQSTNEHAQLSNGMTVTNGNEHFSKENGTTNGSTVTLMEKKTC